MHNGARGKLLPASITGCPFYQSMTFISLALCCLREEDKTKLAQDERERMSKNGCYANCESVMHNPRRLGLSDHLFLVPAQCLINYIIHIIFFFSFALV